MYAGYVDGGPGLNQCGMYAPLQPFGIALFVVGSFPKSW